MKKPFVVLAGPTAVGKTELSISLAKKLDAEIISADSMQVYRQMNIGSAKITREEMQGIPHHLIDVLDPDEEFHVVRFQEMAKKAMEEIYARGRLPLLVGGTGFYIQALLYDIDFQAAGESEEIRSSLLKEAREKGNQVLHDRLRQVDEASALAIHPNNVKRVIRALEFYLTTGRQISRHNAEQKKRQSPYDFRYIVLHARREELYRRIDLRVDRMVEAGLVEEVRALRDQGYTKEMVSMQGLGYKEILDYLEGNSSLSEAVYRIKRDTRHFAKRQLTWFRREPDVIWVDKTELGYREDAVLEQVLQYMNWDRK
ncbi:tRNA (adenosine(37)-N6)-dimethylallyltransferase MiaA [Suipraeoptans intestinalis]|uniref:tRNA (adenosine(37)-N6)-dimethylallyltransferase MiaA n=1 Tax=Suipraeoptans intestinalis TaxID=2606628 RepID=UPI0023F09E60|nr:tRNA (adenosine(37)-N6)-dimethylallyltransferase MiaA [Suipraeoptans intestinalis]MDD7769985.1 tRNA (adenosine(37)-N6)-dimethylallyltransferase MiaA [Suipraeoptans intestinalis]MDY3122098.1 tRNA (adenosine(37)-N6)-dimethylallyltransferase MiaA [Suipraeoptans intestinalis]